MDVEPPWQRDLRRSVRLFRDFRVEQSDPDRFYTSLAVDTVALVRSFAPLQDAVVLDVGAGPRYFADAFAHAGARYLAVDPDVGEVSSRTGPAPCTALGSGLALPVRSAAVDVCLSSNVLEHVPEPWAICEEMLRVCRPGGLAVVSFTVWLGPWGGHETAPWHYLGGGRARLRFERRHGRPPKNRFGESLFAVGVGDALRWARTTTSGTLVAAFPRYHPRWAQEVVRLRGLRELLTWNMVLVLRRDGP